MINEGVNMSSKIVMNGLLGGTIEIKGIIHPSRVMSMSRGDRAWSRLQLQPGLQKGPVSFDTAKRSAYVSEAWGENSER